MRSFTLRPSARTNSWEKVLPENDILAATERSHQSMARPVLPPSRRSQCTEERSPRHFPSTTTLSSFQRALCISTAPSEAGEALELADVLPSLRLDGAGVPACSGGAPSPTPNDERMRREAK